MTVLYWILIFVSTTSYNNGTTTVIDKFDNYAACEMTITKSEQVKFVSKYCIPKYK